MQTAAVNQLITDQLTKFQFNGDNRLEFFSGFPEVAAHFGFTELIYGDPPTRVESANRFGTLYPSAFVAGE